MWLFEPSLRRSALQAGAFRLASGRHLSTGAAFLFVLLVYGVSPAQAGYWTPNVIGTSCYGELNGKQFADGITAAGEVFACAFSSYPGPRCYVTANGLTAWCKAANANELPGASATYHATADDMFTEDGGYATPGRYTACESANRASPGGAHNTAGNPVIIATGRKVQNTVDWSSGGDNQFEFSRQYSSDTVLFAATARGFGASRLGTGWRTNFDVRAGYELSGNATTPATANSGDMIHVVLENSRQYSFRNNGNGTWGLVLPIPAAGTGPMTWYPRTDVDASLTTTTAGAIMRMPDGTDYTFDTTGLLSKISFPGGYTQYLEYSGILNTRVFDSHGRNMFFEYDTLHYRGGLLSRVILPDQSEIRFTYVSRLIDPPGAGVLSPTLMHTKYTLNEVIYSDDTPGDQEDNPRLTYQYWDNEWFPFALTGITDERGVQHGAWTYDAKGRVLSSQHDGGANLTSFAYDDVNNKVTVTNPLGRPTAYQYQRSSTNVLQLISVDGVATTNCAASNTIYTFDSNGYQATSKDAENRLSTRTNNVRGLPTAITEGSGTPEAVTTALTWHSTRQLPASVAKPGSTTAFIYTGAGNLSSITASDTTSSAVPYATNGQVRTTTYGYTHFVLSAPPVVGSLVTPLAGTIFNLTNPQASSGTTGWANTTGAISVRTASPCSTADPCFAGATSATAIAHQDITLTVGEVNEVDSGLRAAKVSWRQLAYADNNDPATIRLLFLDASNVVIGAATSPSIWMTQWTDRERTYAVPPLTRKIRVQMIMIRASGTNNDGYLDNIEVSLVNDGDASATPSVPVANPDARGGLANWTVTSGSVSASSTATIPAFVGSSAAIDTLSQDIVFPANRLAEIDSGARGLNVQWFDTTTKGRRIYASVGFLDGAGQPISGRDQSSPPKDSYGTWTFRNFRVDVPPLARKARISFSSAKMQIFSSASGSFTGISANLVPRTIPQDPVELLTSVDGPLPGTSDTVSYAYDTTGRLTSVTNEVGHLTQVIAINGRGQPTTIRDENGIDTVLAYNPRGWLTSVTVNPGASQAVTTITHDAAGQITRVIAPDSSYLNYTWSAARRLTTVANNAGRNHRLRLQCQWRSNVRHGEGFGRNDCQTAVGAFRRVGAVDAADRGFGPAVGL